MALTMTQQALRKALGRILRRMVATPTNPSTTRAFPGTQCHESWTSWKSESRKLQHTNAALPAIGNSRAKAPSPPPSPRSCFRYGESRSFGDPRPRPPNQPKDSGGLCVGPSSAFLPFFHLVCFAKAKHLSEVPPILPKNFVPRKEENSRFREFDAGAAGKDDSMV